MDVWFNSSDHVETLHDGRTVGPGEDAPAVDPKLDRKLIDRGVLLRRPRATRPEGIDATDTALELAREKDVDLSGVDGTGEDGRIVKKDVKAYIDAQEATPGESAPAAAHEPAESQEKEDK